MPGESGLAFSLTALMNTRRPSSRRSLAARPGEKPNCCVTASTTREPSRDSSATRTSAGICSQWMRTPRAGIELEKDSPPELQVLVDPTLDRISHLVGKRHHQVLVVRGPGRQLGDVHRRVKLDPPLARQRDHAEGS